MPRALIISGTTWVARKELKDMGGRWNPATKAWVLPTANLDAVQRLATELGLYVQELEVEPHPRFAPSL